MIRAGRAFDAGFFADALDPLVAAGRGVTGFPRARIFKAPGIDIRPPPEQPPEAGNFVGRRRSVAKHTIGLCRWAEELFLKQPLGYWLPFHQPSHSVPRFLLLPLFCI